MKLTAKPNRLFQLAATMAALALPAIVTTPIASAKDQRVDGVRAEIKHGTLEVKGGGQENTVALRLKAGDSSVVQVDVGDDQSADFSFARGAVQAINVKMGDGNDVVRVDDANGAFTNTIPTTIAGGDGNDSLNGGLGAETFRAGDGNDAVAGGKGADTAYLGAGDDSFRWDNGDGSDVVEGQDGSDTMVFNGAPGGETATLTANGGRLTFFRVQGNVTMDTRGVEAVDYSPLGGTDNVTVNDLSGTDVTQTNIDLAASVGGSAADGVVDNVVVNGTNGDDNIAVNGGAASADVTGLATAVSITHADPADTLSVNTLAGTDNVFTSGIARVLQVLVDGAAV
jgi:Ca2+-binding RTX toxin-like protein